MQAAGTVRTSVTGGVVENYVQGTELLALEAGKAIAKPYGVYIGINGVRLIKHRCCCLCPLREIVQAQV